MVLPVLQRMIDMKKIGQNLTSVGLRELADEIASCRKCPRLVSFREKVAKEKTKRYRDQEYWGKPVPGFGPADSRLVIIGLAPAAHGGNRTGRVFTGDLSAKFLVKCLYEAGFANHEYSVSTDDGLELNDCYILAAVRCVPPDNIPTKEEMNNCFPFLTRELKLLKNTKAVLLLGKIAFDSYISYLKYTGTEFTEKPTFGHGKSYLIGNIMIYASYHPSPRNTNTGNLSEGMFMSLLSTIKTYLESSESLARKD